MKKDFKVRLCSIHASRGWRFPWFVLARLVSTGVVSELPVSELSESGLSEADLHFLDRYSRIFGSLPLVRAELVTLAVKVRNSLVFDAGLSSLEVRLLRKISSLPSQPKKSASLKSTSKAPYIRKNQLRLIVSEVMNELKIKSSPKEEKRLLSIAYRMKARHIEMRKQEEYGKLALRLDEIENILENDPDLTDLARKELEQEKEQILGRCGKTIQKIREKA